MKSRWLAVAAVSFALTFGHAAGAQDAYTQAVQAELDKLLDGELAGFERFYSQLQKNQGFDGAPLATVERAAVKAYLIYAATERS